MKIVFTVPSGSADTTGLSLAALRGITPRQSECYQTWYPNQTGSPCAADFNTSNGYVVTWRP